jgi:hypothetical protein
MPEPSLSRSRQDLPVRHYSVNRDRHLRSDGQDHCLLDDGPRVSVSTLLDHSGGGLSRTGCGKSRFRPKRITVSDLRLIGSTRVAFKERQSLVRDRVSRIEGSFRQEEIIADWSARELEVVFCPAAEPASDTWPSSTLEIHRL